MVVFKRPLSSPWQYECAYEYRDRLSPMGEGLRRAWAAQPGTALSPFPSIPFPFPLRSLCGAGIAGATPCRATPRPSPAVGAPFHSDLRMGLQYHLAGPTPPPQRPAAPHRAPLRPTTAAILYDCGPFESDWWGLSGATPWHWIASPQREGHGLHSESRRQT